MELPRVSILYPARPGARFDFDYYVPRHLPLAVGTSLRHADIVACDASRPIHDDSPYAGICTVTFAAAGAMADFRHFFASGHPETARIGADEPNYTDITPMFVAGVGRGDPDPAILPVDTGFRFQLVVPAPADSRFDAERFIGTMAEFTGGLARTLRPLATSVDIMTAGVLPGSRPDFHAIWTAWMDGPGTLRQIRRIWTGELAAPAHAQLSTCTDAPLHPVFATVSILDMELARRVALDL